MNDDRLDAELDERERVVVQLVAEGATNRQIAHVVHLSEDHVAHAVGGMMRKVSAPNRASNLVWRCACLGILPVK